MNAQRHSWKQEDLSWKSSIQQEGAEAFGPQRLRQVF